MSGNGVQPYGIDPGAGMSPFVGFGSPIPWPYVEKNQLRLQVWSHCGETGSNKEGAELAIKTTPCWHFVKNEGKCPRGLSCKFAHNMELHRVLERDREEDRKATGTKKASHCWAHVQGRCRKVNCTYLHPQDIGPYIPHTPCVNRFSCTRAPYCPFQHPDGQYFGQTEKLIQSDHIGQLATIYGKPITFNGTTFFPTLGGNVGRGREGGEFGKWNEIESMRNGHGRDIHVPAVTKRA